MRFLVGKTNNKEFSAGLGKAPFKKFLELQPWWLKVGFFYGIARFISFVFLNSLAGKQEVNPWGRSHPAYGNFINFWDSGWYYTIYSEGYPSVLPVDDSGVVGESQWAFYPLYPFFVRALSWISGVDGTTLAWRIFAPVVSFLAGLATAFVFFRIFRLFTDGATSLRAVALFSISPVSPILQIPYAEAFSTLLLALSLLLLIQKRYLLIFPIVVLMCLSRPIGVPFGFTLGIIFLLKVGATWRYGWKKENGRKTEYFNSLQAFSFQEMLKFFALGVFTAFCALLWPLIAWWRTGRMTAYIDTEAVWRGGGLVPVQPWLAMAERHFGMAGAFVFISMVIVFLWWVFSPSMRRVGIVLQMWVLSYAAYLVLFLDPQSSTWRILFLPLIPFYLWLAMLSKDKYYRVSVYVAALGWQYLWCASLWFYDAAAQITPP